MKTFDHPNIPKIYETLVESRFAYIVIEYIEGGELIDHIIQIKQFSEKLVSKVMQ